MDRKRTTSISQIRIEVVRSVASRHGVIDKTVNDKFIRGLRPDLTSTYDFDNLLEKWLIDDSDALSKILLKHVIDSDDRNLIDGVFRVAPDDEKLLSEEFGMDPNEKDFREGRVEFNIHLTRERNKNLVRKAKEKWCNDNDGIIRCTICTFSFSEAYGPIGNGFIEAHHVEPISSLLPDTIVRIEDLVPVCSNCHSMLHRTRPWRTVEQLRDIIKSREVIVG